MFKRNEDGRPLIHPLTAKIGVARDFKTIKQTFTVFANIKKAGQHTHAKCFAKTPGAGDQRDFCRGFFEKFGNQTGFIHIVIVVTSDFFKIRNANGNIQLHHMGSSFPLFDVQGCQIDISNRYVYDNTKRRDLQAKTRSEKNSDFA